MQGTVTNDILFVLSQSTEIIDGFNSSNYDDFGRVVQYPIALQDIQQKIHNGDYRTPEEFTTDFKWILHNCYIYFSTCYTPPTEMGAILKIAKSLLKTCKQEMGQIETCSECYANANSKKNWFVEVCDPPHVLLWAKLKGFPYWPAKAMAVNGATLVDVRFFGAHDRAWVPVKDCYLYSQHNPNVYKLKNTTILQCIKEIEQHITKVRQKYGAFEYGTAKEKYDPLRHTEQLQTMVPGYTVVGDGLPGLSSLISSTTSISPPTTTATANSSCNENSPLKAHLTYKIIKTGDNSCLISPVVKDTTNKNGGASDPKAEGKKSKLSPTPPEECTSPSAMGITSSTTTNASIPGTLLREAIKPTKIVIKNSYDEKNNKQYELVTPTEEKDDITASSATPHDPPAQVANGALAADKRKVGAVVMKRKSDKWQALSKRSRGSTVIHAATPSSREASPKRDPTTETSPPATTTTREVKRRNTEEVIVSTTGSATPSKIKIRRITRASNRPPVEEVAPEANEVDSVVKDESKGDLAVSQKEEEAVMIIEGDGTEEDTVHAENVSVKPPITTVKDVLDQLPQISIVPSRKNSVSRTNRDSNNSRLSSRSSSKSSNRGEVKSTPEKRQSSQTDSHAILAPENLMVKIEPISDDDEVEITVNGGAKERQKSVEIIEEEIPKKGPASSTATPTSTPPHPRARKTFARNIGNRPKPPSFNAGQANNMVLIPRELSGESGMAGVEKSPPPSAAPTASSRRQSPNHMLSSSITPNLAAAVTKMISQGPPRLVRKPSGTLQSSGDVVFPSEAGSSCRILMENAHKMTDFFRSVIEDTLSDMADKGCMEAQVQLLMLELEKQKYKHQKDMAELKSNTGKCKVQRG